MNKNNLYILLGIIVLIMAFFAGMYFQEPLPKEHIETDTIYMTKTDTFKVDSIIPKYIVKTKTIRDTLRTTDSIPVEVNIPIETAYYDSTLIKGNDTIQFKAHISGYKPRLDSLWISTKVREKETITTHYVTKNKRFIDRFHLQPQVTSGYDVVNRKWGLMVGVGIGFDL